MIKFLKNLLRSGTKADFKKLVQNGAQVIDVRTVAEFRTGHISCSVNIPLQDLPRNLSNIKKNKPVITCCASGIRSASAKSILKSHGFQEVYNGRSWMSLQREIS